MIGHTLQEIFGKDIAKLYNLCLIHLSFRTYIKLVVLTSFYLWWKVVSLGFDINILLLYRIGRPKLIKSSILICFLFVLIGIVRLSC